MKILARLIAAAAFGLLPMAQAATSSSTDYSDLWWNPAESGWGAHITLQGEVAFVVLFVYDAQRQPRFFVAPNVSRVDFSAYPGETFIGALYATDGPPFAGAFDPSRVTAREVGSLQVSFVSPSTAQLRYTVSGAAVTKILTRQGWRTPDLTGNYLGGLFATATPATCPFGASSVAYPGSFRASHAGDTLTLDTTFSPGFTESGTCRYTGRLAQAGSLLAIPAGTYTCEFGNGNTAAGTFEMSAIESGPNGFAGRYSATEGAACRHTGYFGGMRRGYRTLPDTTDPPQAP